MSESTSTGRNEPLVGTESRVAEIPQLPGLATGFKVAEMPRSLGLAAGFKAAGLDRSFAMASGLTAAESRITEITRSLGLAAGFKIAKLDRALGLANGVLKAPFNPVTTQALLGGLAGVVSNDVLDSISALGSIDVDRIVEDFSTLAREDSANASLRCA